MHKLTALGWKSLAKFAQERAEEARTAHGPGKVTEEGGTVTLHVGPGFGTLTADADVSGRVSWKALALLLASKVNAETLASGVAAYNAGNRPTNAPGFAVAQALEALDVGTTVRRGSIRTGHAPAVLDITGADVVVAS